MLIVFSLSVCLSVSLSISLYLYSVYDLYNNNNNLESFWTLTLWASVEIKLARIARSFVVRTDCKVAEVSIWVGLEVGEDSDGSFPHEHLTICPLISVPWTATIACVADSFVLNLQKKSTTTLNKTTQRLCIFPAPLYLRTLWRYTKLLLLLLNTEDIFTVCASNSRRGHGYKL